MAYLTDDEKRLLFSALLREKKVCKEIDKNSKDTSSKMLVPIVVSLQNKFKYNKFEQDIYEKAYKDGQDKGLSDGWFFGRNEAIDEFADVDNIGKLIDRQFVKNFAKVFGLVGDDDENED